MESSEDTNLLLTCGEEEFDVIIHQLSAGEILNTIGDLHHETSRVQQNMKVLQEQIKSLPSGENSSERYNDLVAELKNSQGVLAKLINKSMKCFAQHKQKQLLEKEPESQHSSSLQTDVRINAISNTDQFLDSSTINHSSDRSDISEPESVPEKSLKQTTENKEMAKGTLPPSNGISHVELGKKTSPVVKKSPRSSLEGNEKAGGGRKLIQEYSVKTPLDDIRAEIFKTVDKTAKENVSKLLVNNVAHFYNKDVKLHSKDDILAFKAEIESQAAAKNNKLKGKVNKNAQEETGAKSTAIKKEVRAEATGIEDVNTGVGRNDKIPISTVSYINVSNENKNNTGISVTEVTLSSSSTDRSPEPTSKNADAAYFKQQSTSRIEEGERISATSMLARANVLEKFLQGRNGGAVSDNPPVKNFKIKSKGPNSLDDKIKIPVSQIERTDNSSAPHDEKNSVEGDHEMKYKTNDSMTEKKDEDEGNKNKEPSSPRTPDSEKFQAAAAPVAPLAIPLPLEEDEEPVKERVYLSSWDPTPLLKELYEIRLMDDDTEDLSYKFIEMEGLMEKLPMNKKKATLLKTWKRRYFRAKNGWLVYYDNRNDEKPSDELLLMGGQIHAMGNQVIGIDDGGGRYLMVRCPSQKEYEQWLTALESQITDNTRATYVRPSLNALKHPNKKVVMIEFGSMSIRAGILKENATLPQLFFPNAVAVSSENNMVKHVIGFDAYKPEVRHSSQLVQPFGPTDKVDKFKVDFDTLPSVFTAIFKDLKIATEEYYVMLILPLNIRDEEKSILMNILINQFKVSGVCMAPQALLALYSYNTQSGIIVDIGERLEVLPIYEGFVIDGGHTVQSFGAPKIRQSLRSGLTSENYPLYSPLEQLLVRLVQEETCFVSKNFNEDCQQYQKNPEKYQETLYLKKYNIPDEIYTKISHSLSRFVSPEGLFNTDLWGMDYPTIQSLVMNAIQACPMDNRRHLCRSIYLSGGVTLLPGFASRLESELRKRLNETIVIQVHASPQRYHAAYIGACALCSMSEFEKSCITSEEWKKDGTKAFQKWKMTS